MGQIVCITSGLTGILNASFELVNRLQLAGHTCTIASPLKVKEQVESHGFKFLQLNEINFEPAPDVPSYKGLVGKLRRLGHKIIHYKERKNTAIDSLGMEQFMNQVNALEVDLFIVDVELHEHIMTLFANNHKVLLLSQWFSTWKRKGLPPIQEATIPGVGFKGSKLGLQLAWMKVELKRFKTFFKKKLSSIWTDRRSVLQAYAQKIGFSKKFIPQNYWPGPFSYDLLPVISMTTEGLDFSHDVRPNMEYVGAMVYTNRKDHPDDEVLDFKILKEKGKKLIYCSVSTFSSGDVVFIKKLIAAISNRKEWNVVISIGRGLSREMFTDVPENVHLVKRVNQIELLSHCDLSINHGGIHTINECLHFKVPMLVYSGKRSDQNGCAARVHYHGVGLMADKDLDFGKVMVEKIEQALSDSSIQENIESFYQTNLQYKTACKVERLVESVLKSDDRGVIQLEKVS